MMPLQCTRNPREPELEDLLKGFQDKVLRIDELHANDQDDSTYVWIIWLKDSDDELEIVDKLTDSNDFREVLSLAEGLIAVREII
jgi:hypothetical protein